MIFTNELDRVVYVGYDENDNPKYVGKGILGRHARLLRDNMYGVIKVELFGPFCDEDAKKKEFQLIQEYAATIVNKHGHPTNRPVRAIRTLNERRAYRRKNQEASKLAFSASPKAIQNFLAK